MYSIIIHLTPHSCTIPFVVPAGRLGCPLVMLFSASLALISNTLHPDNKSHTKLKLIGIHASNHYPSRSINARSGVMIEIIHYKHYM